MLCDDVTMLSAPRPLQFLRNYRRLNVRYARLRQTPVRFTFTQAGEMVEDEDYEPPPSSDEEEEQEVRAENDGVKLNII